jgi:bla regulator protein blaR1
MTPTLFLELIASVSLQAAIVVTATHWIGRLTDDERTQSRLWTGCYALLLMLVFAAAVLPHVRLFQTFRPLARPLAAEIVSLELQVGRVLFFGWLIGCFVSFGLFIYRTIQAEKFLRTCRPVDPDLISLGAVVSHEGHGAEPQINRHTVKLVSSPAITSPFCWQFHRPYIVIPDSLLTYEDDNLKFILRHELAHLRTGHPIQVFLQRSVEIIFWFHPMVWWASHESALAREFMCDDEAVETRSEIVAYLKTLLTIVEQNAVNEGPQVGSLAFVRNRNVMAERARRLVHAAQQPTTPGRSPLTQRLLSRAAPAMLVAATCIASILWLPINVLASPEARWSPWPEWTAHVLHDFGVQTRDFEVYDHRYALHELFGDEPVQRESQPSP